MSESSKVNLEDLSGKEAGDFFGVTAAAVHQWVQAGLPFVAVKGKVNRFRWRDVFRWWLDNRYRPSGQPTKGAGRATKADSEARKASADARLRELRVEREEGRLVPLEDVEAEWTRKVVAARARLLALPARLRGPLGPEAAGLVDKEIRAVLSELAAGTKVEAA